MEGKHVRIIFIGHWFTKQYTITLEDHFKGTGPKTSLNNIGLTTLFFSLTRGQILKLTFSGRHCAAPSTTRSRTGNAAQAFGVGTVLLYSTKCLCQIDAGTLYREPV